MQLECVNNHGMFEFRGIDCPYCHQPLALWAETFKGSATRIIKTRHLDTNSSRCGTEAEALAKKAELEADAKYFPNSLKELADYRQENPAASLPVQTRPPALVLAEKIHERYNALNCRAYSTADWVRAFKDTQSDIAEFARAAPAAIEQARPQAPRMDMDVIFNKHQGGLQNHGDTAYLWAVINDLILYLKEREPLRTPAVGESLLCLVCAYYGPWRIFSQRTGESVCEKCIGKIEATASGENSNG